LLDALRGASLHRRGWQQRCRRLDPEIFHLRRKPLYKRLVGLEERLELRAARQRDVHITRKTEGRSNLLFEPRRIGHRAQTLERRIDPQPRGRDAEPEGESDSQGDDSAPVLRDPVGQTGHLQRAIRAPGCAARQ